MSTSSRTLSLAHLTVLDTTPPELIAVADAAGFRTIGIRLTATPSVGVPPYDALHDGPVLRETLARLKATGISVLDTEFLRFEPDQPVGIPEGFLEVSARLGAKYVLVMSAEPDEGRTLERFVDLCDRAARYGLHVCLEFAIYTGVRTLAHAAQMVTRSERSNASVSCRCGSWSAPCLPGCPWPSRRRCGPPATCRRSSGRSARIRRCRTCSPVDRVSNAQPFSSARAFFTSASSAS
jgi:hypothetical protein